MGVETVDMWWLWIGLLAVLLAFGVWAILWALRAPGQRKRGDQPKRTRSAQEDGYDEEGYDQEGYDREGYNRQGYNEQGYDREGYDRWGYDGDGYDRSGYDWDGYDRQGYNRQGYTIYGRDVQGRYNRLQDVVDYTTSPYSSEGFLNPAYYPVGVTHHARQRMEERMISKEKQDPEHLARQAYCFGKSARQIKKSSVRLVRRIESKYEGSVVLIYHGYVYIFSSDNQLITVYRNEHIPL